MLSDIVDLDSRITRTIKRSGVDIDPGDSFGDNYLKLMRAAWSFKTDSELELSINRLASGTIKMYYLLKSHQNKAEIQAYIDRYRRIMAGLNRIGVIEPDYFEGKA